MNVVGYTLSGQDNGTYMFRDKSTLPTCSGCHCRLDFTATNSGYWAQVLPLFIGCKHVSLTAPSMPTFRTNIQKLATKL